jgi:hypothetical protein
VPADVFEEYDFDTRGQFAGLVRDWKERLEAINPYVPVVPQEGIPSRERERVSELYQAIYADPEKRADAYYAPARVPEAREFYDAYSKYQDLVKSELRNRGAVPIRERFRAFEEGTGLDDYSPVSTYNNSGAFQAAEHESYSHQIPYEEGFALDYRPFNAGRDVEGNRIIVPANTVTPLNENLAGVVDTLWDRLRRDEAKLPPSSSFRQALERNNVALLEGDLRKNSSGRGKLDPVSQDLLETRLGLAYPENLPTKEAQVRNPALEADVTRAGELFTEKYVRPAFDQMQGLIKTQFPGIPKDAGKFLYAYLYKPTLERMDKAFGGNVADLGNYFFAGDPVSAAASAVPGVLQNIKKVPSSLLPGAADLIPSPEAIRTGYAQGPAKMGKQMAQEFIQSLPTAAGAAMLLSAPALAPLAPGIGAGMVGTAGAKALNEVVRQETGEGVVPKLRQALGTATRTGVASPARTGPQPLTAQIRPLTQAQRKEQNRQQNRSEFQRRMDLAGERFNPRRGEFGLSELLFGR